MKNNLLLTLLLGVFVLSIVNGQRPTADTSGNKPDRYAVVVGISDYQDEAIPDLRFADKDAEAFAAFLQSPAGGSLDEDHLKVLINEEATVAQFAIALDWLWEVVKEDDKVIIYFSGHGDVERKSITQPGYLLCWDAPSRVYLAGGALALPMFQDVITTLSAQNKAKVIVITDACRSGKLSGSSVGGAQITGSNLAKQYANEIKILSCQPDEYSIEGEQWGGGRGAFSYHLLDGLTGMADGDEDYTVSLREIRSYLEENVSEEVEPQQQLPMVVGNGREKLTDVFPEILNQLKEGKKGQLQLFTATASRGIEDEVLAAADSNIVEMYLAFQASLKDKQFLEPANACADFYYAVLSEESQLEKLHSSMRRNYAAALQDDAQQVMNIMLNSGLTQKVLRSSNLSVLYADYPLYLNKAAELLGKDHYMYATLQSRKHFFRGVILQNTEEKLMEFKEALSFEPNMPHAMVYLIRNLSLEQIDSAKHYFQETTTLIPSWVEPYISMSVFFHRAKLHDKAEEMLFLAEQTDSTLAYVWYNRAQYYGKIQKDSLAEKIYLKILKRTEENICFPCVHINLGFIYDRNHRYEEAEKQWLKAIELDSINPIPYNLLGSLYKIKKQYEEAEKHFFKAIELDSFHLNAYINLGNYYTDTRQYEAAEKHFLKAIQIDSNSYLTHNNIGTLFLDIHQYDKAEKHFFKAIELDSNYVKAYNHLGLLYKKTHQYDKAEKHFFKAIELDSNYVKAYNNLGTVYLNTDQYNEAEKYLKKAIQLDSNYVLAHSNLGTIYKNTRRYVEAEKYYLKAIQLDSTYSGAYNNLGNVYKGTHRYVEAEKYYLKAIQLNARSWIAYANLGLLYQTLQRWKESEVMILKSIELGPSIGLLAALLGNVYTHLPGRLEEAKTKLDKALEMSPDAPDTYIYLTQWSLKKNQPEDAWQYLEQAFEKGIGNGELKIENLQMEPDFEEMRKEMRWKELMQKYFPNQFKNENE